MNLRLIEVWIGFFRNRSWPFIGFQGKPEFSGEYFLLPELELSFYFLGKTI
ncbi:hypothetical protein LEP1GSC047_3527 [Leptospira inadai serovar Lyme str. 10]|uniref:Uncharacterized protein n=1 Tax=Leptospira inadai serovar Lyme str. 10 TaxID=1049790 RepID=V6HCH6_9LEPT|nr:hypothetical protein LEP1GSC047_3527 [Leptospira inadai serovar Lyme str. 10]